MQVGHRSDSSLLSPVAGSEMSCRQSGAASPSGFGLGAVPGLVPSAGCQAAAGQPGGLQPELLAGGAQVRLGGLVQGRAAVGQLEVGGQVAALVVPAGGQVGYLVQARDRGVGAGDAAQQLLVELPGGSWLSPICQYTAARPCRRPRSPAWRSAASGAAGCGEEALTGPAPSRLPRSGSGGGGDQADPVSVVQEHGQGASAVPADVELAGSRVVAGDGSLVAGPEPGVRVAGVLKGDPVAAPEPVADVSDLADPGEPDVQLGDGRPGAQVLTCPGVGHHGAGGLDDQVRAGGDDDDAGDPRAGVGDLGLQLVVVPRGDVRGLAGQQLGVGHREAVQLV